MFLAAAALRLLQPRQHEPARTSWAIFEWALAHISHLGATVLFIGMPGLVVSVGGIKLLQMWHTNQALRDDVLSGLGAFKRHLSTSVLAAVTLVGTAILAFVVLHLIAD
jgi:hypothetical protein